MVKIVPALAMALAACAWAAGQSTAPKPQVEWLTIDSLNKLSATTTRPMLIKVYTGWCVYCRQMDAAVWRDHQAAAWVNQKFYPAQFDGEQRDSATWTGLRFGFNPKFGINLLTAELLDGNITYPGTVIICPDGFKMVLNGAKSLHDVEAALKYVVSGAYKTTAFEVWTNNFVATGR
jgi:hypothetical protein